MNVLVNGLGSIAKKHINAIKSIMPKANIFGYDIIETAIENINLIEKLDEFEKKIDFVIISNPTNQHYLAIEKALKYNCPIFIEKPSLHTLSNVNKLLNKIQTSSTTTYVACNMRFHPAIQFLKDSLSGQKRINEINVYCGSYLPNWRPNRDFRTIYSANKDMGGGVHLDLIHELDYCYWLFGKPKKVKRILKSNSSLEISSVDYANYSLIYNEFIINVILNYYRKDTKRSIEVLFEDKTWIIDLLNNRITDNDGKNVFYSKDLDPMHTYLEQMNYFINKIKINDIPMNSLKESIDVLEICLGNEKIE